MEDTGVTSWGQSAHLGTPFYPALSSVGKAPHGPANVPRWDTGKSRPSPAPCQLSFLFSSPHRHHPSPGKPGGSSKHAVQRPPEIFGHVAHELAVLSQVIKCHCEGQEWDGLVLSVGRAHGQQGSSGTCLGATVCKGMWCDTRMGRRDFSLNQGTIKNTGSG